jgi:hypothetical protein
MKIDITITGPLGFLVKRNINKVKIEENILDNCDICKEKAIYLINGRNLCYNCMIYLYCGRFCRYFIKKRIQKGMRKYNK